MEEIKKIIREFFIETLQEIFSIALSKADPEYRSWLIFFLISFSCFTFIYTIKIITTGIYSKLIKPYLDKRQDLAKYRIETPGSFAWGNRLLRAPLVAIGTDIYCFAQISNSGKILRYLKFLSVFIPTAWVTIGMTIFVSTSEMSGTKTEIMLAALPIALASLTVFTLDMSIINHQGGLGLKFFRFFCAIVTGYVFSSIPLNFYFKSSIDSYMASQDNQIEEIKKEKNEAISRMQSEPWYISMIAIESSIARLREQAEQERLGHGKGKGPNSPTGKNPIYNQITSEIKEQNNQLQKILSSHSTELTHFKNLVEQSESRIEQVTRSNGTDHIKRHVSLWRFAFSSPGVFFYFFSIMIFFWIIDSMSVISSFISEPEYEESLEKQKKLLKDFFSNPDFSTKFQPFASQAH